MIAETNNSYRVSNSAASPGTTRRAAGKPRASFVPRKCEPIVRMPAAADMPAEPTPIWLAALIATECQATANGGDHAIRWNHVSGRAIYTNSGPETETIEPFGVSLLQGHTVAVSGIPGETAYTVEA